MCYEKNDTADILYKKSYELVINLLTNIKGRQLNIYINEFIHKIGVPVKVKKESDSTYSNWNLFIYFSILAYLHTEAVQGNIKIKINLLVLMKFILFKRINKLESNYKVISLLNDTKEVMEIKSLYYFLYNYLDNHFGSYKDQIEFWIADHLIDELDEYRNYLISRAKKDEKKNNLYKMTYEELEKKYRRKKLNY